MLTISQLAAYAGVTVRAVRHYHARGLLAEPERDHSGYRSYDAAAVVELIKIRSPTNPAVARWSWAIRTLAEAGVPLGRVRELLAADEAEFAAAVAQIDRRLRAEIRDRQRHRQRIAQLAAGDSLVLPPAVVDYLDQLRALGATEEMIAPERDAWILMAARWPERIAAMMAAKTAQLDDPRVTRMYELFRRIAAQWDEALSVEVADLLIEEADLLHELLQEAEAAGRLDREQPFDASYTQLMDSFADDAHPVVAHLRGLIAERGWSGWTRIERRTS
jgi:DNA-binding transcriptional MerR regulator